MEPADFDVRVFVCVYAERALCIRHVAWCFFLRIIREVGGDRGSNRDLAFFLKIKYETSEMLRPTTEVEL